MFVIGGYVQNYPWGIPGGLGPWLQAHDTAPQAELWFGAHPNGPSPLVGAEGTLADVVDPHDVPLLVKILAARCPLSIQLHPDAALASQWFEQGSDLVSDPYAKEEMLVALEPFAVYAGWRPPEQAARLLEAAMVRLPAGCTATPALVAAVSALHAGDIPAAVRALLGAPAEDVAVVHQAIQTALTDAGAEVVEQQSYDLAGRTFPGDNGLLVLALLDHRLLPTHGAVYMPVGGVHAYARGVGLEVMTSSDNVLRLGLTGKRVAVDEALLALREDSDPHFLSGESEVHLGVESRVEYRPAGAAFEVTLVEHNSAHLPTGSYRCVLCLDGEATVTGQDASVVLHPGQACAILAGEADVSVRSRGTAAAITAR